MTLLIKDLYKIYFSNHMQIILEKYMDDLREDSLYAIGANLKLYKRDMKICQQLYEGLTKK